MKFWTQSTTSQILANLALLFVTLIFPHPSHAEQSEMRLALDAYAQGELDRALEAFEVALAEGNAPTDELVTIHVHLGILRGASGDIEAARRSFEIGLALNPMLSTPSEAGGQLRNLFEDLREARSGRALSVVLRMTRGNEDLSSSAVAVEMHVLNSPPGLVRSVRLRTVPPGEQQTWTTSLGGSGGAQVTIPNVAWSGAPTTRLYADVLDQYSNILTQTEIELVNPSLRPVVDDSNTETQDLNEGEVSETVEGGDRERRRRRWPWYRHPAFWSVVGSVVVGGIVVGVVLGTAETQTRKIYGAPQIR